MMSFKKSWIQLAHECGIELVTPKEKTRLLKAIIGEPNQYYTVGYFSNHTGFFSREQDEYREVFKKVNGK